MPISEQIKADWCAWDASNTCVSVWFTIVRGPIRLEPCSDGHIWQYRYSWINQDRMLHKADVENIWQQNWLLQSSLSVQRAVCSMQCPVLHCSSQTVIYQPQLLTDWASRCCQLNLSTCQSGIVMEGFILFNAFLCFIELNFLHHQQNWFKWSSHRSYFKVLLRQQKKIICLFVTWLAIVGFNCIELEWSCGP